MEDSAFEPFQSFSTEEDAAYLVDFLNANDIEYEFEKPSAVGENIITKSFLSKFYFVKLKPGDFDRVTDLLAEQGKEIAQSIPEDYYLKSFTDEELIEMLKKPDEWPPEDLIPAREILLSRGINISESDADKFREQRLIELKKPQRMKFWVMVLGIASSFLGGLWGIIIGWRYMTDQTVAPDGEKFYTYDSESRQMAWFMMICGIITFLAGIVFIMVYTML